MIYVLILNAVVLITNWVNITAVQSKLAKINFKLDDIIDKLYGKDTSLNK